MITQRMGLEFTWPAVSSDFRCGERGVNTATTLFANAGERVGSEPVTALRPPSISFVNPVIVAAIAFVAGAGMTALIIWLAWRERPSWTDPLSEPEPVTVPHDVAEVLAAVRSSAIVVGPQDEVIQATGQARTLGLVRGSRLINRELLGLTRSARRDRGILDTELQLGSGSGSSSLQATVAPVGSDLIVVLVEDKTAERRVEDTRRDFVANVSHELKTPIGAVSLLAEALEDSPDDPEAVRRFANRLSVEARRLSLLVGQIIELSRLQADDPLLRPSVVAVDRVLASAVDLRRVDAEKRGVTLTVAGESGLTVLGSDRQLTTAIGNLVENAVVYSDQGARVVVAANLDEPHGEASVEITVSDNGIGISQADLDRIFERFYRVDYARSRDNGGTGLGLSIVKHVAAAHRGEVSVWSRPGRGSTFTIRIPTHPDSTRPDSTHPDEVVEPLSGRATGDDPLRPLAGATASPTPSTPLPASTRRTQETTR